MTNKTGKVDPTNGKKGTIVSLDVEEYDKLVKMFGCPRIEGDEGPGELVQSFDDGTSWNVRWINSGKLGYYYTGAFKQYHIRIGANGTDKSPFDVALLDFRRRVETGLIVGIGNSSSENVAITAVGPISTAHTDRTSNIQGVAAVSGYSPAATGRTRPGTEAATTRTS